MENRLAIIEKNQVTGGRSKNPINSLINKEELKMTVFAQATRKKFRFETNRGMLSVEDLWDLPLESASGKPNLDDIAKALHKSMKEDEELSFVKSDTVKNAKFNETKAKFDIVKHIIDTKLAEADAAKSARVTKEKNQKIMELIAQKDDEALASKSREELLAMLQE